MNQPRRILIVNPFGIGDVLFSTPLVRAVRRAFPDAYVAYLCNRRTQEILRRNRDLHELFIYEKDELVQLWKRDKWAGLRAVLSLLQDIRRRRFELAIDLSLGERYSFFLMLVGVPRRIGFDFRRRGRFLTHRLVMDGYHDQHVVEYYAHLLLQIGIRLVDRHFELVTNHEDREAVRQRLAEVGVSDGERIVGLIPAGGVSWGLDAYFRRWAKEGFIEVGRALRQRQDVRILIFGEANDRSTCAEIAQAIGPGAVDFSGHTTLGQFVSFIGRCQMIISNDGGPIHIAASQGIDTVSIFGPVDPVVYGPYPASGSHRVIFRSDLPCRPCYHQFKLPPCPYERACLTEVEPADVLDACEAVLNGVEGDPVGATAS